MKKLFLLVFMWLITSGAMGADCTSRSSLQCYQKNNATNGYCYWGLYMGNDYICKECPNVPLSITNGSGNVFSGKVTIGSGVDYDSSCPMEYKCNTGYAITLEVIAGSNSNTVGGQYNINCTKCSANEIAPNDQVVTYWVNKDDGYWGSTIVKKSYYYQIMRDGASYGMAAVTLGCQACGTNATANSANTNCNCNYGYQYCYSSGACITENINGERDCSAIPYKICLKYVDPETGAASSDCNHTLYHKINAGYSTVQDGTYTNSGSLTTLFQSSTYLQPASTSITEFVKIVSDYTNPDTSTTYFSNLAFQSNLLNVCKSDSKCVISSDNTINLYIIHKFKTYKLLFQDGELQLTGDSQTCTYGTDCVLEYELANSAVKDGYLFDGVSWLHRGSSTPISKGGVFPEDLYDAVAKSNHQAILYPNQTSCPQGSYCVDNVEKKCPENHYCPGTTSVPQPCGEGGYSGGGAAECSECDAGYYCANGKEACPTGTTSDAGATAKTECYVSSATKFKDASGREFTLPIGKVYVK